VVFALTTHSFLFLLLQSVLSSGVGAGGDNSLADADIAVVLGGTNNTIQGAEKTMSDFSIVGGGNLNTVVGVAGTVLGGSGNTVHYDPAKGRNIGKTGTIAGGHDNEALGNHGAVLGGHSNDAKAKHHSTVGGGVGNDARGSWSTVGSGGKNQAGSNFASVLGGYKNKANSRFATVLGGSQNTVNGVRSVAVGHRAKISGHHSFALSLTTGNQTCVVDTDRTVSFCAGTIAVNGEDISQLFSRRQLAQESTEELAKTVNDHQHMVRELQQQLKEREAVIEELLHQVDESELTSLREELSRLSTVR